MNYKLISVIALVIVMVLFVVQNTGVVEIRFLFWKMAMSRVLVMLFVLIAGVAAGWLLHGHVKRKR